MNYLFKTMGSDGHDHLSFIIDLIVIEKVSALNKGSRSLEFGSMAKILRS